MLTELKNWRGLFLLLAGAASCVGCNNDPRQGYTLASQYRPEVKSVVVEAFTRGPELYRRGLEMRLTEAVVKRIAGYTPYKIVYKGQADTKLTGTVEQVSQRVLSSHPDTGGSREMEMIVVVSFRWQDLRTGNILAEEKNIRAAGGYIPLAPFNEDFFQGSEAALNNMAIKIVEKMEAPW